MTPQDSLRLHTFGGLWLQSAAGPVLDASSQRHRLALLALVAASGDAGISRDRVLSYLWPFSDDEHARHSLAQLVYSMRHMLGRMVITGEAEFRLDPASMTSDVSEFLAPRVAPRELAGLYAGPFLDGFHLKDAPEFTHWVDREREKTTLMACAALERLGREASRRKEFEAAVEFWRRRVDMEPMDEGPVMALMEALASSGDRPGAIRQARNYGKLVREELGIEPDPQVETLADRIREDARKDARRG